MTFAVVIPARNRADLVVRAVRSALAQDDPPDEVVVVDDASTDSTAEVAGRAGARVIRVATAGGSGPARTIGARSTTSPWVAFLDSDDEWDTDHLTSLAGSIGDDVLVSSGARSSSGGTRGLAGVVALDPALVLGDLNPLVTSGTAVRRDALAAAGWFRPLPRTQDLDCWVRVLEQGPGTTTGRQTVTYHEHDGQVSHNGDLNRRCVLRIIDDCAARPWCDGALQRSALARFLFDDLRTGQRTGEPERVLSSLRGIAVRPAVWPALGALAAGRLATRRDRG